MRFCLQAPYLSFSDSTIGGKMSRLEGWWLSTDLLFAHLKNRKHVRVSKVIVHQNFSTHTSDIALLKLGEEHSIEKHQRSNILLSFDESLERKGYRIVFLITLKYKKMVSIEYAWLKLYSCLKYRLSIQLIQFWRMLMYGQVSNWSPFLRAN